MIKSILFYEGNVAFATHKKNIVFNNLEGSKNHVSEHSRLESVEKEVIELKNMIYQLLEANKKYFDHK